MHEISIISMIFTALLALGCLYLILAPILRWDSSSNVAAKGQDLSQLKESLLTTLNEIEFEYKMDKISSSDYKSLKKQYEVQIAGIMKDEEQLVGQKVDKDLMDEVEREIEAAMKSYKQKGEEK